MQVAIKHQEKTQESQNLQGSYSQYKECQGQFEKGNMGLRSTQHSGWLWGDGSWLTMAFLSMDLIVLPGPSR